MNKKIIFVIIGGIIVIGLIIYFIFIYNFNDTEKPADTNTSPTPNGPTAEPVISETPSTSVATPATVTDQSREEAGRLSLAFAERYGSSSSQSDFNNLRDLEVFMTAAMQERSEQYIAAEQAKPGTTEYEGTTTKAVTFTFESFDDAAGTAVAVVRTKRQEKKASGETRSYDQSLTLGLKKVSSEWRVDSAAWSK